MKTSQNVLPKAVDTVKSSSLLAAQDVNFYASIDRDMSNRFRSSAKSLLNIANDLLQQINKDFNYLKSDELSTSASVWNEVEHILDACFERADYIMDSLKTSEKSISQSTLLELDSSLDLTYGNIDKPQSRFEVPVDNTDSKPFQPKLNEKPNATIPLEKSLRSTNLPNNQFCNPYAHEIMHSSYPDSINRPSDIVPPTDWKTTGATWVDNVTSLREMLGILKTLSEIAVDLEHHDLHSYYGLTCLMQISNRDADWIIDTIALRDDLIVLNDIFTNPNVVKVFHGANMDIIWLQRDLGLYVVSLFDTYHASKELGLPKHSLAYLLETFAGFRTSKKYQLADWRVRPLPKVLLDYARADTHFLLSIFDKLKNSLISNDSEKLNKVLNLSRLVACRKFEFKKFRTSSEQWSPYEELDSRIIAQYNIPGSQYPVAKGLLELRDELARKFDESVRYIMPNKALVNLCALLLPATPENLKSALGKSFRFFESSVMDLLNLINSGSDNVQPYACPLSAPLLASARHIGELFLQIGTFLSVNVASNSIISPTSKLIPALCSSFKSDAQPQFGLSFKEFGSNFKSHDQTYKKRSRLEQDEEGNSIYTTNSDSTDPGFEIPRSLKKRSVVPHNQKHSVDNRAVAFDYEGSNCQLFEKLSDSKKIKKSYEPFKSSSDGGPKKAKGRKGFQNGKSLSFSKRA